MNTINQLLVTVASGVFTLDYAYLNDTVVYFMITSTVRIIQTWRILDPTLAMIESCSYVVPVPNAHTIHDTLVPVDYSE